MINAYCFYSREGGWARHAQSFFEALAVLERVALHPRDGPLDTAALSPASRQMLANAETANDDDPSIGSIEFMERMSGAHRVGFLRK